MEDRKAVEALPEGTKIARTAIVLMWKGQELPYSSAGEAIATLILKAIGAAAGFGKQYDKVRAEEWDFNRAAGYAMMWESELSEEEIRERRVEWDENASIGFVTGEEILSGREVRIDLEALGPVLNLTEVSHA